MGGLVNAIVGGNQVASGTQQAQGLNAAQQQQNQAQLAAQQANIANQQNQNASLAQQQLNSQQAQTTTGIQGQQQGFANAVLAPTIGQQAGLTSQLQADVAGQGPNVALNQLNQTTGQNIQSQAALQAGQRGAGANVGLMARQIGQQGAATQQNAVGQAATLGAQQQVAYTGMLQQQLANQQSLGVGAQQNAANTAVANQGMTNSALQQQASLNSGLTGQGTSLAQTGVQAGEQGATNVANVQGNLMGQANASTSKGVGSDISGLGSAAMMMASGGPIQSGPKSHAGKLFMKMAKGGAVPALVSPGERYLPPSEVKKVAEGKKNPIKAGEKIPGKPKVGGAKNSYANDTVPKTLQKGGIVLPRSVTQSKDPAAAAHNFVSAILAKQSLKKK